MHVSVLSQPAENRGKRGGGGLWVPILAENTHVPRVDICVGRLGMQSARHSPWLGRESEQAIAVPTAYRS